MEIEPPASDEVGEFTGNGAVANPPSMETPSLRTEKEPSPSQSSSSDELDGDDLEDLNVEQLQVLISRRKRKLGSRHFVKISQHQRRCRPVPYSFYSSKTR